jgi:hypothetical protein
MGDIIIIIIAIHLNLAKKELQNEVYYVINYFIKELIFFKCLL